MQAQAVRTLQRELLLATELIEKIARCEVPHSNELATRMQRWCQDFITRGEVDGKKDQHRV